MDETVYKRSTKGKQIVHGSEKKHYSLRFHGKSIDLARRIRIGRDRENDVVLSSDPLVSRQHAVIELISEVYWLRDLNSTNQTYLNNSPLPSGESAVVRVGDIITIGHTQLQITHT